MKYSILMAVTLLLLLSWSAVLAAPPESWQSRLEFEPHPFMGWTWDEIQAHPDFIYFADENQYPSGSFEARAFLWARAKPSSAQESAEPGAEMSYNWIGFIILKTEGFTGRDGIYREDVQSFVCFDDKGAGVTMVEDRSSIYVDFVPIWFVYTLSQLIDASKLDGYP